MTNWLHTDNKLKVILHAHDDILDERKNVLATKRELLAYLKSTPMYNGLDSFVIVALKNSTTFYSFNSALEAIYGYADDNKIWLGF